MAWEARSGLKLYQALWVVHDCFVGMAWEARSGLKQPKTTLEVRWRRVGMAWEARSGLKLQIAQRSSSKGYGVGMAWEARSGLKQNLNSLVNVYKCCRNGLGSPFGFETTLIARLYGA